MGMRFDGSSFFRNVKRLKSRVKAAGEKAIDDAGQWGVQEIREAADAGGPSQETLNKLGNPYAKRHGTIQGGVIGGKFARNPWLVTKRSGALMSGIQGRLKWEHGMPYYRFYYVQTAPHVAFVVQGTRVMLPRDIINRVLENDTKQKSIANIVVRRIRKAFK